MAQNSGIEWTDASWTPIRARNRATGKVGWHCEHTSDGCRNCYSEGMNLRLGTGLPFKPGHRDDIELFLDEAMLLAPLKWKRPRMVFVCSMTDLFADFVPEEWIDRVFAVMTTAEQHTFQVLTKRAERMRRHLTNVGCGRRFAAEHAGLFADPAPCPLPNVWLGVSAERQHEFNERWPDLEATDGAVRFVSYEPMLGPLVLGDAKPDWVIAGCESIGPRSGRPYHLDWVSAIRDECQAKGVAFFLKQLAVDGRIVSLPELDGRQWREFPATRLARAAA